MYYQLNGSDHRGDSMVSEICSLRSLLAFIFQVVALQVKHQSSKIGPRD